jgi:excisionase family DNA binding protein
MRTQRPGNKRIAYSVIEFAGETSLSRSLIYAAIKAGELRSVKVRSRRLILASDGEAWLQSFALRRTEIAQ